MNCEQYDASLSEYVDGTLQASEEPLDVTRLDALEAHLAGCERCRALVEDLHTLRQAAQSLEPHLPPACRAAFLLHDVEGFGHQEVGAMLGISEGTSKSQVHKARMRIRHYLAHGAKKES